MPNSPAVKVLDHMLRTALCAEGGSLTDGQLLQRFIELRDDAAFAVLVHRLGPMVWGVCRRLLGRVHDIEDAFQATFLVLVRKAAVVVPREGVGGWLHGVAYHTALKARAQSAQRRRRERQVTALPDREELQHDVREEVQAVLDYELARLPDKYRLPIVLCDLGGRSRKEVARQLQIPEGTLSSRLTTARTTLGQRLARRGVAVPAAALAALVSQQAAAVPTPILTSTIKAAVHWATHNLAAGKSVTGVLVSAQAWPGWRRKP